MTERRPGEFELFVLLAAIRLGPEEAYAVSIADDIRERTGRRVRRSNVYTALQRLEDRDLVSTRLGDPRPERGGKARRLVSVTADGLRVVQEARADMEAMARGLEPRLRGES